MWYNKDGISYGAFPDVNKGIFQTTHIIKEEHDYERKLHRLQLQEGKLQ